MVFKGCTPETATSALVAELEKSGIHTPTENIPDDILNSTAYHTMHHAHLSRVSREIAETAQPGRVDDYRQLRAKESVPVTESQDNQNIGLWASISRPNDILPENIHKPLLQAVDDFAVKNSGEMKGKFYEWKKTVNGLANDLRKDIKNPGQEAFFDHYVSAMNDGYPFFEFKSKNPILEAGAKVVQNTLDLSSTVLLGNPAEILVKAPSIYGHDAVLPGIAELNRQLQGDKRLWWGEIPELKKRGYYDLSVEPSPKWLKSQKLKSFIEGYGKAMNFVNHVPTDRPAINLAYSIGYAKTGTVQGGLEAIEKVMFKSRLGNDRQFTWRGSRQLMTLANYTFNTYHWQLSTIGGLFKKETRANSARAIATYAIVASAIGGPASMIPAPLASIFKKAIPEYEELEKSTLWGAGPLIQPGGLTFGIPYQILERQFGKAWKKMESGSEALSEGDYTAAAADLVTAGMFSSSALLRSPVGNMKIQKTITSSVDLFKQDMDQDTYYDKLKDTWLPAFKEKDE